MGVDAWNAWRDLHADLEADLSRADLSGADLREANLTRTNLEGADLAGANLRIADLKRANLSRAALPEADLSEAELKWAVMQEADLRGAALNGAKLVEADLYHVSLNRAVLWEADLSRARLAEADLSQTYLNRSSLGEANLRNATLSDAKLIGANMRSADLTGADLRGADLKEADLIRTLLRHANLTQTNLCKAKLGETDAVGANFTGANLIGADFTDADLSGSDLSRADLRSATLQKATLNRAIATGARLWETQRAGWSIKGIVCECAFWDRDATAPTNYSLGEFERLYSEQTCIELFYHGGVSTFELNTLPALLHHLANRHPNSNIRLKSIEETGGGARISISIGDPDSETADKIKSDALKIHQAQLALRDNEILRLQIQKEYLESFVSEKLVRAVLSVGTPRNIFNASVTGVVISSGKSKVDFRQTANDNSALLALLEGMMDHRGDLDLPPAEAAEFSSELQSATAELQKKEPDESILSRSIGFIQKLASEAVIKAAGKLGEAAAENWHAWLLQLSQVMTHWR